MAFEYDIQTLTYPGTVHTPECTRWDIAVAMQMLFYVELRASCASSHTCLNAVQPRPVLWSTVWS